MTARPGVAYLVGAGPGDPGLMTARSLELIATADCILYDRLIPTGALDGVKKDAEIVYVGKQPGVPSVPQEEIGAMLVERAAAGKSVVRLKGGDPFLFGRGGEEAEDLVAASLPFEVVPGVTAGVAAPAYAGIPVTHREEASAVAFVTGHENPEKEESALDWNALASFPGTLVLYMGIKNLPDIAESLIEAGRDASQPAAVIERGTLPGQRVAEGTLGDISGAVEEAGIRPPAITLIGPVAARREQLAWLERRPLHGRRIVVTRARAQSSGLARQLEDLGADVIELPAIRIVPRTDSDDVRAAATTLGEYDLVCLTSANGVELFFDALANEALDARAFAGAQVAVIGSGTADALRSRGIEPDYVPERFVAEGLLEALEGFDLDNRRVLLATAAGARDTLPKGLRERGGDVDVVALYETMPEAPAPEALEAANAADYVTFTSASTVRYFLQAVGDGRPAKARNVSIGPVTSQALRDVGLEVHLEAERHDIGGLVKALIASGE